MSLIPFITQKAEEKGIVICSHCHKADIFYALDGKCLECGAKLSANPKEKTLQFALEVLIEFTEKYDEFMPSDNSKKIFIQLGKAIIHKIKSTNEVDNTKLIQFQHLCSLIPMLGSNQFGGAVNLQPIGVQIVDGVEDSLSVAKSLGAVILSYKYIAQYKVSNEYIIESKPTKPKQTQPQPISSTTNNKGCLFTVAIFSLITVIVISILLL